MESIKVSYQNIHRRFAIPKTITWSELESNLRTLFSLPPTFSFALSYEDEDGDAITLSSNLELQDIFSQVRQPTTLKFKLIPYKKQPDDNEVIDQLSEPSQYNLPTSQQSAITDEEPSFIPTISSVKGKKKVESSFNNPDPFIQDEQNSEEQSNQEQTSAPFIDLAAQFQKVIDQLRPMMEQQPQLIDQANKIMDQILHNIPVDIEAWTRWFDDKIAEAQKSFCGTANVDVKGNDGEKQESSQRQSEGPTLDIINNPLIQRMNKVAASIPSKLRDWQNGQLATDEVMNENLELLRTMGFHNDIRNKELLKKHQGDIERVVDALIDDSEYSVVDTEVQMEDFIF